MEEFRKDWLLILWMLAKFTYETICPVVLFDDWFNLHICYWFSLDRFMFLGIYPFSLGYPIYWHMMAHNNLLIFETCTMMSLFHFWFWVVFSLGLPKGLSVLPFQKVILSFVDFFPILFLNFFCNTYFLSSANTGLNLFFFKLLEA